MHLRVVKLGGSLLTLPQLCDRLAQWYRSQVPALSLMVVGGGPLVDSIRDLTALHDYDEEFLHWLCIDVMDISYRLLAAQLPAWSQVHSPMDLQRLLANQATIVASGAAALVRVSAFYDRETESHLPLRLPHSWDTTSDSLAALLAQLTGADELVLLKSCSIPGPQPKTLTDWEKLAGLGIVDRAFPLSTRGLKRVRCVNLLE